MVLVVVLLEEVTEEVEVDLDLDPDLEASGRTVVGNEPNGELRHPPLRRLLLHPRVDGRRVFVERLAGKH